MNRLVIVILLLLGMAVFMTGPAALPNGLAEDGEDANDAREAQYYDRGREALDKGDWDRAYDEFGKAAKVGGRRADGALYWKAYALNKLGRRSDALATLEQLRESHPGSRWIDDARALEVEIKQSGGKQVPVEAESNEELKLMALNGLLNMDPDRAVPMLEKFIGGGNSQRLKEQALFVLVQTGSPRARDLVTAIARGQSNPGLQRKAIEYIGLFGDEDAHRLLKQIYSSSVDDEVKQSILQAYMTSGDTESLLAAVKDARSGDLRVTAVQLLGAQGARDELWQLYRAESDSRFKEQILQALAVSGDSARLLEAARTEKDPRLRRAAIQALGITGSGSSGELVAMYRAEKDRDIRRAVLDALFVQGDAGAIIDIARRETDPEMRREAVSKLSVMGSKEATDFLLELLNK